MSKTKIEWADMTINPVVGCSKCSHGCDNCYAERQAARLVHMPQTAAKYAGVVDVQGKWTGKTSALDLSCFEKLPKKPQRIFVGSMCDLFYRGGDDTPSQSANTVAAQSVTFSMDTLHTRIAKILAETQRHKHHTFIFLTKRAAEMQEAMSLLLNNPLPNVWLGVTVCNQAEADAKIPVLLDTPAAKRFVSVEPMLGAVDLTAMRFTHSDGFFGDALQWHHLPHCRRAELQDGAVYPALDWVICGGETGPKARPMHPDWVRWLRDQCKAAGTPFFFKGRGEWQATTSKDIYNTQQSDGSLGREFPNSEGRAILADGRCCLIDIPEKPTKQFLQKRGYRLDAKRGHYISDQEAMNEAHKKGLHVMGYQWMYCTGKARAGRLLDGVEYSEVPA